MSESHFDLASRYFEYLANRFPVMCASDEFHFLPRATNARKYYDHLESLSAPNIRESISELKKFRSGFKRLAALENDLESQIDLELLLANIAGVLIELETNQSWRHNPLLYLKIAFIGLDQALTKPETFDGEKFERAAARLDDIPGLIGEATKNISEIPETYYYAALAMLRDCQAFIIETGKKIGASSAPDLTKGLQNTLTALDTFANFLSALAPVPNQKFAPASLETTLKEHFLSRHNLKEVYQIAVDEWHHNLHELQRLQKEINSEKSWQELYHAYIPAAVEKMETLALYQHEADRLRGFFNRLGFMEEYLDSAMSLVETPTYLCSVRSTASFAAAFTADEKEISYFFITTHPFRDESEEAGALLKKRLHREYRFLTAHETIPGHQLLDSVRRKLANPVRRQIESPLFYEGWATYAETLLTEYGYVDSPIEYLVDYKRRLWRNARCQIDAGLHGNFLEYSDALKLLTLNGFAREEARRQIARFRLNPGYQLCYSLGCHEIKKLVKAYKNRLGEKQIHGLLLEGGQLPFHLIEKRFKTFSAIRSPN